MRQPAKGIVTAAAVVAVASAALAAVSAGFNAGHFLWPASVTAGVGAVLALAGSVGKNPVEAISAWLAEPFERLARRSAEGRAVFTRTQRVRESRSRIALNIHTAIPLPDDTTSALSVDFPEYVARDIDDGLRSWLKGHLQTGGMVILAGDAAAGKTRCLYEALYAEAGDWRMPQARSGSQINSMVREQVDLSRSVLWLDELQKFFADDPLAAASVRQLLTGRLGPVVIAGTIRDEELSRLQVKPSDNEPELAGRNEAREVVRMLARWSTYSGLSERAVRFHVSNNFSTGEMARARTVAMRDPRLASALRDADTGNVTATLAGAPELIDRWTLDTGDSNGRAIITAAVVARRYGHPEPIPAIVLETLALAQLAASGAAPAAPDWLKKAISWAENPVEGNIAALKRTLTSPGVIDGYKVSDILLQHSYEPGFPAARLLEDNETWDLLQGCAALSSLSSIGDTAYSMGETETAEKFWTHAAQGGDIPAMRRLGWFCADQGRLVDARRWFQQAINLGDTSAMQGLGSALSHAGELEESAYWLRQAAGRGDAAAMVNLGFALHGAGNSDEAIRWYERAAELGSGVAMANLGHIFENRGDLISAEQWNRKGAALGNPGAMVNLADLLKEVGKFDESLGWFRKAAERALSVAEEDARILDPWPSEGSDEGVSDSVMGFADLLVQRGEISEAELWFKKIAALGDSRAAAALAEIYQERAENLEAAKWLFEAARLADSNLVRNKIILLTAYGEQAVLFHVKIIRNYADYLAAEGETEAARDWQLRAAAHLA